jgi:hypothetical protein
MVKKGLRSHLSSVTCILDLGTKPIGTRPGRRARRVKLRESDLVDRVANKEFQVTEMHRIRCFLER